MYAVVPSSRSSRRIEVGRIMTEAEEEFVRKQRAQEAARRERERRSMYDQGDDDDGYYPFWGSPDWGDFHSESHSDDYREVSFHDWDEESNASWDRYDELDTDEEVQEVSRLICISAIPTNSLGRWTSLRNVNGKRTLRTNSCATFTRQLPLALRASWSRVSRSRLEYPRRRS